MKSWFKFKYPKIALFCLIILGAYFIFQHPAVNGFVSAVEDNTTYTNLFLILAGMLVAFGFSAPIGIGFLVSLSPEHILFSALIAGLGAMLGDILIFKFIRMSFMDEFKKIEHTKAVKEIGKLIDTNLGHRLKHYLLFIFADLIIISPLPDEIGVTMLAGMTKIKPFWLGVMSFCLHFAGAFILLSL